MRKIDLFVFLSLFGMIEGCSQASLNDSVSRNEAEKQERGQPPINPSQSEKVQHSRGPSGQFKAVLDAHNQYRSRHCAQPLRWSDKIAAKAQAWAEKLRDSGCAFQHSQDRRYGENLFYTFPSKSTSGVLAAQKWYAERDHYSFRQPGFSMKTGHFTQMVWRGTKELGCGLAPCNGGDIWVCNYSPPGNVRSHYRKNVLPQTCR